MASEVVEPDRLLPRALEVARMFTGLPPTAVRKTQWLLDQAPRNTLAGQLEAELTVIEQHTGPSADAKAARRAMVERLRAGRDPG